MKKLKLLGWFILAMGWLCIFMYYLQHVDLDTQSLCVLFLWAPLVEEVIFRELPFRMAKRWNCMGVMQVASSIAFGWVHQDHYFLFGVQYCMLVQGMMAIIIFQIRKEYNLFWCMIFHASWNATIFFIFNYLV